MKRIAIIGSGGLGREVLGIIQSINKEKKIWEFIGFYDDNLPDKLVNGFPVIDKIEALNSIDEELYIIIGIGNPRIKELLYNKIVNPKIIYPTLIHPSVIMYSEETISLGKGVVIGANSVLTVNIEIGDHVYVNTTSVLSHDVSIGRFCMLMPTVSISTGAKIGERVYLGNGVIIDKAITLDSNIIVKAGTILSE